MLKEGKLSLAGPQCVLADSYGGEYGDYESLYNSLSDLYQLDIIGSHYNSNGDLVFDLLGGNLYYPNYSILNEVVVNGFISPFPQFTPYEPLTDENAAQIFNDFITWFGDHTAQIPDENSNAVNNVTDNCLKAIVQSVINGDGETNPFSNILKTTFGAGSEINLNFSQYNGINEMDIDGKASGSNAFTFNIELNLAALNYSSNENITATIYHEIIHAYFYTQQVPKAQHHDIMADVWRGVIASQLLIDYPNLSQSDADALAWGGLGESRLWQEMNNNDIANNTSITGNIVSQINNHRNINNQNNGSNGTHCN